MSAALHFSLCCSAWKSKRGHKAGRIGEQPPPHPPLSHHRHHPPLPLSLPPAPPRPQITCSVSSEGTRRSSGETQRNHRAYLSLLPPTLNYSLKPPEFFLNWILQSAPRGCWSRADASTDQAGRERGREAEGYHVILKNLKHNVFLFFFFPVEFFLKSLFWL